jgi:hypothetical protein
MTPSLKQLERPISAVPSLVSWIGLAGLLFGIWFVTVTEISPSKAVWLLIVFAGWPMIHLEITKYRPWQNKNAGFNWNDDSHSKRLVRSTPSALRVPIKLLGLASVWILLAIWLLTLKYYQVQAFTHVREVFAVIGVVGFLVAIPYFYWIDRYLSQPFDGAWHTGATILSVFLSEKKWLVGEEPNRGKAIDFTLGWFIKVFFFVFLASVLPKNIEFLQRETFNPLTSLYRFVFVSTVLLFTIDIVLALVGYVCTTRLLNAHIRSTNNSWIGWAAALSCYPPFALIGGFPILDYRIGGTYWDIWLSNWPLVRMIWACLVIISLAGYVWATIAFGYKFSNLTNRGTLTHGAYRISKHPAYLSKNFYWWLIFVPWINNDSWQQALVNCALLTMLSLTYLLRAKTEEAHLRLDPEYQKYVAWFDSNSLWQRISAK